MFFFSELAALSYFVYENFSIHVGILIFYFAFCWIKRLCGNVHLCDILKYFYILHRLNVILCSWQIVKCLSINFQYVNLFAERPILKIPLHAHVCHPCISQDDSRFTINPKINLQNVHVAPNRLSSIKNVGLVYK